MIDGGATDPLELLKGLPGVVSGISCRPVDAASGAEALRWVRSAAGGDGVRVAMLRQVHGRTARRAPWPGFPERIEGDCLVTDDTGLALAVRVADCAPVALATSDGACIGMIHAGRRGLVEGVVEEAVAALCAIASVAPVDLRAAIGPVIGGCCYSVDSESASNFDEGFVKEVGGGFFLDLPGAIAGRLEELGLHPTGIDKAPAACTCCGSGATGGVSFHSHRGSGGAPGRNVAYIMKAAAP